MARRSAWGSIQAAGPGIWRLRYPLPNDPSTGKRRRGYETVHGTKKDASKRLREISFERLGDTWVCEGDDCEPLNPDLMSAACKRWHFGKPHRYVPWMNLRNSYATMLHAKGVDLGTVAKLLGHATPTVAFQHYGRMSAEQLASVVSVLGNPSE